MNCYLRVQTPHLTHVLSMQSVFGPRTVEQLRGNLALFLQRACSSCGVTLVLNFILEQFVITRELHVSSEVLFITSCCKQYLPRAARIPRDASA